MNWHRILKYSLFLLVLGITDGEVSPSVDWMNGFEEAKAKALQENKLILVDFWAEWCGPCIRMDREVWNQYYIEILARKFVCLRVDIDMNNTLAEWYNVSSIPAMVFTDGFGTDLIHITGYRSAQQMGQIMDVLPGDVSEVYTILRALELEKNNGDLLVELADKYRMYGMSNISNKYYRRASKLKTIRTDRELLDHIGTYTALNYLFLGQPKRAKKRLEKCLKRYPESQNRPIHLNYLVRVNLIMEKKEKASQHLETLKSEFPGHELTRKAEELMEESSSGSWDGWG